LFQGPFFESDFDISKIADKITKEAKKQDATIVMIRGPIISLNVEPYLLIRKKMSMSKLSRTFKERLISNFEDEIKTRIVFVENGEDPSILSEYPLEIDTKIYSNRNEVTTSSEEFCVNGMYMSFTGYDPIGLAWNFVKSNRHNCKGNIKRKMIKSISDQKTRCPLTPRNTFIDPRNIGRCHTFGKPLDLLIMCSRKFSMVDQFGQKLVLSTQPFVTRMGFRQFAVISMGAGNMGNNKLRVEIHSAESED
jgi:hypothetical protein